MAKLTGFTLIEMLLVTALLVIIVGLAAPLAFSMILNNDLASSLELTAGALRRASDLSAAGSHDSQWGVETAGQTITIFSGSSFAGRDSSLDEVTNLPSTASFAASAEIVFNRLSGEPTAPAAVTLTNPLNQTGTVNVNAAGLVSF